jgi:hypothetical protein
MSFLRIVIPLVTQIEQHRGKFIVDETEEWGR